MKTVLHLIDSLAAGGAERVAVNLFNLRQQQLGNTWLCSTREAGPLRHALAAPEQYLHLGKKSTFDLPAFVRLAMWVRRRRIAVVHAHASSVYWAVALKWVAGCTVIWHDHHGNRPRTSRLHTRLLRWLSSQLGATVVVSEPIRNWHQQNLRLSPESVKLIRHFPALEIPDPLPEKGRLSEKVSIICVANLRPEKGHLTLLTALKILVHEKHTTHFHLKMMGRATDAAYLKHLENTVRAYQLSPFAEFWGLETNLVPHLMEAEIGILSSDYEGLPLALLEYGQAGLACVCSAVGDCAVVLNNGEAGILTPPGDAPALAEALFQLLKQPGLRQHLGAQLRQRVTTHYSATSALRAFNALYESI